MDKKYTLVYSINNEPNPSTVYINLTNACTNSCVFCLREQKDDVCGAEMWHDGNYTLDDIIARIGEMILVCDGRNMEGFEKYLFNHTSI